MLRRNGTLEISIMLFWLSAIHRMHRNRNPSTCRRKPSSLPLTNFSFVVYMTLRERFDEVGRKIKRETDGTTDRLGRRLGPVGTLNTITPCAACKLLRRRCAQECPFSPYFPPHEPQKFASVHKVFGASNVSKLLMVLFPTLLKIFHPFY